MSYDLQIYSAQGLSAEELRGLLTSTGLSVEDSSGPSTEAWTVVRGAKRKYSFTLALPVSIEPEDVPGEVTGAALDVSYFYELLVEGSSATEVPHAVRFGRCLAEATNGVLLDQQNDKIWSRRKLRQVPRVDSGVVSTVEVRWYVRTADEVGTAADAWLKLVRRHLPEALPRRYGTFEPLGHKLEEDGPDAFVRFVREADNTVFFKGTKPVTDGSLVAGPTCAGTMQAHDLTLLADPLAEVPWRTSFRRLFVEFAESVDAVLATAEVVRNVHWSGRSLGYDGNTERATYVAPRGNWEGLPPYPVWWAWFGHEYTQLVREHLPADQVEVRGTGLFHWRSDAPADRDSLKAQLQPHREEPRGRLFRRKQDRPSATWLPAELLATEDRSDPNLYNPLLIRAQVRPASLS
ncbi:hypothetical protein D1871_22550 [Nakamurella silvestris]|nr:hypothetical protein D1871_22550 [Nakamurella silvestris]